MSLRFPLQVISWGCLAAMLLASVLYMNGYGELDRLKFWTLIWTVIWFVLAPMWVGRKQETPGA